MAVWIFRFSSSACVEMVIKLLDGVKVGGASLAVKTERVPHLGDLGFDSLKGPARYRFPAKEKGI